MHPQGAPFLVIGHGLDHGAEDVRVDLFPIQTADVEQVGTGDGTETGRLGATGKQPPVHVGEAPGPAGNGRRLAVFCLRAHGAEQLTDHRPRIGTVAHLLNGVREGGPHENAGIFGKEAEDEPRHEAVYVMVSFGGVPVGVGFAKLHVQTVEPPRRLDVKSVPADLRDRGDARQRQEHAKVVGEVRIVANDNSITCQVFRLELLAVGSEDQLHLGPLRGGAVPQSSKRFRHLPRWADLDVDVVGLEHTARQIGPVGRTRAEPLDGGGLVAKGFQKGLGA